MSPSNRSELTQFVRVRGPAPSPAARYAEVHGDTLYYLSAAPWRGGTRTGEQDPFDPAGLLCPVEPSKIIAIGRNYRAHAQELGNALPAEPLMFLKPPSALLDPGGVVTLPGLSERVDYEAELGVVIGKRTRHATRADAESSVFGYTALCDVTARDLQKKDGQWTRAKGFDGFCPTGPRVVRGIDASALSITLQQNGAVRQQGNTRDLVFSIADLVVAISRVMTLEPGDLIATGTPEGVGPMQAGDRIEIEIEGVGLLSFSVERE